MSSLLHAFILLFDVVKDLFCSEPGGHLSEGRRLHAEVFLWGRAGGGEGGTSPSLRGGGRAVEGVEVDSPFERGSAGHVLSCGPCPRDNVITAAATAAPLVGSSPRNCALPASPSQLIPRPPASPQRLTHCGGVRGVPGSSTG